MHKIELNLIPAKNKKPKAVADAIIGQRQVAIARDILCTLACRKYVAERRTVEIDVTIIITNPRSIAGSIIKLERIISDCANVGLRTIIFRPWLW
jgi:hypothetical protein